MPSTVIHLEPTKAKRRAQIINDALPGIILLFTGLGAFLNDGFPRTVLPYVDLVVGIVVVRTALTELRLRKIHRSMNWFDVSAGCVILIEAGTMYKSYKGFQPAHLLFLIGVLTIARGIFVRKIPVLRKVEMDDEGISVRSSLFRAFSFRWKDIRRINLMDSAIEFVHDNHTRKLNLRRFENRSEIIEKIADAAKARGVGIEQTT